MSLNMSKGKTKPFVFCLQVYSEGPLCLPKDWVFLAAILAPLCLVLVFNVLIFAKIAACLFLSKGPRKSNDHLVALRRFKQLTFLFLMLGLNWTFGVCQFIFPSERIFDWLLCISVAFQGFAYFVFFVIMHEKVLDSLKAIFRTKETSSRKFGATSEASFSTKESSF
jgi:hypothetical protein